jgi:hypothetical protein
MVPRRADGRPAAGFGVQDRDRLLALFPAPRALVQRPCQLPAIRWYPGDALIGDVGRDKRGMATLEKK